jgi:hypothetical protein
MKKVLIATLVAFICIVLRKQERGNASARLCKRLQPETSNEVEVTDFDRYEGKIV